ncbi:cell division protein FtsA [Candidatus Saccharibacteria bacterium]|nr:cell division protein FtsA [Candidatus Saccharibacteria bacterium]
MDEVAKFAVGLDVGTENVRAVVVTVGKDGAISVVGYNEGPNNGMRKGVVANLTGPGESIDRMLGEVERMSGYEVNSAYVSINGANVMSTQAEGMVALGPDDHEITDADLDRVEQAAVVGRVPANRDILDVLPLSYTLDGQSGIKDPIGMVGSRLEMRASVLSVLAPNALNLRKATERARVTAEKLVPSVVAAAKAVLSEKQMENGVAIVDFGSATTSVAIYEEGDLQYVGVIPVGSHNITNDLAIMLKIDTDIAEDIKRRFVAKSINGDAPEGEIIVHKGREEMVFSRAEVNQIIEDRLAEIFDAIRKELKGAKYDRKLPEGVVLVGGGAKLKDIAVYAREALEASIKIGMPKKLGGVADAIEKPEYATAIGLAIMAAIEGGQEVQAKSKQHNKSSSKKSGGLLSKIFKKF